MEGRETGFLDRAVEVGGAEYRYQVYVPRGHDDARAWPVVLFLHGAGERGSDGIAQTEVGIGTALRRHADRFPCVVVFPQCRPGHVWSGEMEAQALRALDASLRELRGDPARVYLTGISMGGYGAWAIAGRNPGRFAALAVVCGGVVPPRAPRLPPGTPHLPLETPPAGAEPYGAAARLVARTPAWVFHGADDDIIPVAESRRMVKALKFAGADVRYTEYASVGHASWNRAYAEPALPGWMLSHRLGG